MEKLLIRYIQANPEMIHILALIKSLRLPQWFVGAGFVRNFVWDVLHDYKERTPLQDIDVLYYDKENNSLDRDKHYERLLLMLDQRHNWSVKNQARMHLRNNHSPYTSVEDAMKRWPETATAVAVKLNDHNELVIVAPYGLEDLFG
ncbi:MAG: hypothetical protein JWM44_2120 [Bacilli bacterium]|nr:hypothetical protein [Bacilli bacterium]